MSTYISTRNIIEFVQTLLTFIGSSICLFLLSIVTYLTLRKLLLPVSHLAIPISLGLPPSLYNIKDDSIAIQTPIHTQSYLVSYTNLSDPMYERIPLDISTHSYRVEFICHSPRSYRNRQIGSFFVQLLLYSTSHDLILEHSRSILFPYESDIVRLVRTLMFLPLSIFHIDYDRWSLQETLVERLTYHEKSKSFIESIQLNILPSTFQLDQCSLHFHIRDLTGIVYFYLNYPIITGFFSVCVLFSTYMTFYLVITGLSMIRSDE